MLYGFAQCIFDLDQRTLYRDGEEIHLSLKVFEVLHYLITQRHRVISKHELCDVVWKGITVSNAAMESCVRTVRTSVGDNGQTQQIIQTQRGFGYRFIAEVLEMDSGLNGVIPSPPPPPPDPPPLVVVPDPAIVSVYPCLTCQHPNHNNATFCAACGTRLRQTCTTCGQSSPLPAAFCTSCGQPFIAPTPPNPLTSSDTFPMPGERKPITVLCCTVDLMTTCQEGIDIETRHRVMQGIDDVLHSIIRLYGGRQHAMVDNTILILFGVPVAREDDARRAIRVALELRQHVHDHLGTYRLPAHTTLALRFGVHTGPVVVGRSPDQTEAVATVVGDVISGAIALQQQAPPQSIVCSAATARLLHNTVRLENMGRQQLPGHRRATLAYTVLADDTQHTTAQLSWGRMLSPFVGRDREMLSLHALFAQVTAGRGQVVGVVGEAGIGKSRLLYEFQKSLPERDVTYLSGHCLSYGTDTPYLPVLALLRHICGITTTNGPDTIMTKVQQHVQSMQMEPEPWTSILLHLFGVHAETQALAALSPEVRKTQTMTVLTQLCLHSSRQRPLVLGMEDLHWIDASSQEWLTALVDRIAGAPILLLVTYRPGYRPPWIDKSYATQVSLHALAPTESLQVVQTLLPTATLPTPLVPQLLAKADGNPFFLEELARTVAEHTGESQELTVPDTVQAVLTARVDRLPSTAKRILQAAAVIGKDIPVPLLQAITAVPADVLHRDLRHLQATEFLYETSTATATVYTFKHALTHDVTYHSLVRDTRQQYHARIAQVLETEFPDILATQPALLARHYTAADDVSKALPYWYQAGQHAVQGSAHVEAVHHFTQGIELLQTLPPTPDLTRQELTFYLSLAPALRMLQGHTTPDVARVYHRAHELAQQVGDRQQQCLVLLHLWRLHFNRANLPKARALAEQYFTLLPDDSERELRQDAHRMLGSTLFFQAEFTTARQHLEAGMALYHAQPGHPASFRGGAEHGVVSLSFLASTLWQLGYPDQALHTSRTALQLAHDSYHTYSLGLALQHAALLHEYRREASSAQCLAEQTIALAHQHEFVQWLAGGSVVRGWALAEQGQLAEGLAQMRQGMTTWQNLGTVLGHTRTLCRLAQAYARNGQTQEGLRTLDEALAILCDNGEHHYETEIYRIKGECLLAQSRTGRNAEQATEYFQKALTLARQRHAKSFELRAAMSLGRLWHTQHKSSAAYEVLAEVYTWFTEGFDTLDLQEAQALLQTLEGVTPPQPV